MRTIDKASYEGDIVSRLRHWRGLHLAHSGMLFEEAAAEIERLRNGAACPHVRGTVTQHCSLNFTLTDEERVAVEEAARMCEEYAEEYDGPDSSPIVATLRSLLERIK